jgi:hypothetical protein
MKSKNVVFILFLFLLMGASINAQVTQTGAIRGVITDKQGGPLPGVNVILTSPSLLGSMSAVTNESGEFRFLYLPPGVYTVVASLQGFQTVKREGVVVRVGMTVTINLEMPEESLEHEITVVAASPTVDVVTTKSTVVLPKESIQNIPIARNDINNLLNLAPGTTNLSIKGGARNNHAYNVDGVNDNAPNQNYGEVYISWDTVEEVEIVTGQAGVETFQGIGGAINIVTKSGGNRFSGEAQIYYTNKHLSHSVVPQEKLQAVGSSLPPMPDFDYDFSFTLGGPFIKDKISFLANFRYQYNKQASNFIPTTILGKKYDPYYLEQSYRYLFMKVTSLPWKNFRVSAMATIPRRNTPVFDNVPRRTIEANRRQILDQRTTSFNAVWTLNPNTFIEFIGGNWWNNGQNMDTKYANSKGPYFVDRYTGYEWGRGANSQSFFGFKRNYEAKVKFTHFKDDFLGADHQMKGGVELQIGSMRSFQPLENGMEWDFYNENPYYYRGLYGLDHAHPEFGDGLLFFSNASPREGTTKTTNSSYAAKRRIGVFIQDLINIKKKFSLTLGLRLDTIKAWVPEIKKTEAADPLGRALGEVYIKPVYGVNPFGGGFIWTKFDNAFPYKFITPFIGISYDISGAGKTALKLSYGRYPEGLPTWHIPQPPVDPNNFQFRWWDTNGNGQPDLPGIDNYQFVLGATSPTYMVGETYKDSIDPNIKIPYEHQVLIGLDHELFHDFAISLNYTIKIRKNELVSVYYDRSTGEYWSFNESYFVPFKTTIPAYGIFPSKEVTVYFRKANHPELFLRTTNLPNDKLKHRYGALELSFTKRMSHGWSLGGSVVHTHLKGNLEYSTGSIQGAFRDPNYSINRYGDLAFSIPLMIKLFGTAILPYDLWLSFFYQYIDGNGWGRTVTVVAPQDWRVANNIDPSYTQTTILVEPPGTRRNQSSQSFDLRIEKKFSLGRFGKIGAFVDIFNALGFHSFSANVDPGGFWMPTAENSTSGTFKPGKVGFNSITGGVITFKFSVRYTI